MQSQEEVELAILELYEEDIIKCFYDVSDHLALSFSDLLEHDLIKRLNDQYTNDKLRIATEFWKALKGSPTRKVLFTKILQLLKTGENAETELLRNDLFKLIQMPRHWRFLNFIKYFSDLVRVIDQKVVQKHLTNLKDFAELLRSVSEYAGQDVTLWKKALTRKVLVIRRDLQSDFLNILLFCGTEANSVVEKVHPGFVQHYKHLDYERSHNIDRGAIFICDIGTPIFKFIDPSYADEFKIHIQTEKSPYLREQTGQAFEPENGKQFVFRQYQLELAEPACSGKNTVICAPTGSGKTDVAKYIVRKHFTCRTTDRGVEKKVCFLVTNTTFLQQQADVFKEYLSPLYRVDVLSGAIKADLPTRTVIDFNDIIISTPQMILNLLVNEKDVRVPFSLSTFSMMIFDECHHASLCHPYNEILKRYHDMKQTGVSALPQIIGLTASIGIGDAKTFEEGIAHLLNICGHLDCAALSRVRKNKEELYHFSPRVATDYLFVEPSYKKEAFYNKVIQLMSTFEERFLNIGTREIKEAVEEVGQPPNQKDSQAYEYWYCQLKVRIISQTVKNSDHLLIAMECFQFIEVLYKSLNLCAHLPCRAAQWYLFKELKAILTIPCTPEGAMHVEASGILKLNLSTSQNELFETLYKKLLAEFKANVDSRAIVFVKTREIANRLSDALNDFSTLRDLKARSGVIVGINSSRQDGGQKVTEQRIVLEQFTEGELKILCTTSVAEEGIDIRKCNLVINYNYVTNEIARVQRRGRGRAKDSRCILLTNERALIEKEKKNALREKLMEEALDYIDTRSEEWFQEKIEEILKIKNREREQERLLTEERKILQSGKLFNLLCKKCNSVICRSDQIVTDSNKTQYVVIRPDFWSLAVSEKYSDERKEREQFFTYAGIGTHKCGKPNCSNIWGRIVVLNNVCLPILRVEAFALEPLGFATALESSLGTPKKLVFRKWKKVCETCFSPRVISSYDLTVMKNAQEELTFTKL